MSQTLKNQSYYTQDDVNIEANYNQYTLVKGFIKQQDN